MKPQRNMAMWMILVVVLSLTTAAFTQEKPATQPTQTNSKESNPWEQMLKKRMDKIELVDVRFTDAIDYFRDLVSKNGLNIVTKWGELEVDNPEIKDKQVTVQLVDIPFGQAMQVLVDSAGGGIMKLGYNVEGSILTISTAEIINSQMITKTYNVSDLMDPNELDRECSDSDMNHRLINTIRTTIDHGSWYPNGNAQLNYLGGVLVVTQIQPNQTAVEQLLEKIRKAGYQKTPVTPDTQAREMKVRNVMLGNMADTCFNSGVMGIAAVGGLRTETPMEPKDQIQQFEDLLSQTKSLGIRNAIRLTLKDLYIETGNLPKAREHLKKIIEENDEAPESLFDESGNRHKRIQDMPREEKSRGRRD
ncbi:MAG: tetratricopeptide repeat protein [Phycisphaerae bacterium]|nr:tetratricopeptide repeat protein [Phycisphaerae bacterium]